MATKYGQFLIFGGQAPRKEHTIIDNDDYELTMSKTWIESTKQWHIQFVSPRPLGSRWEMFLTNEEIKQLREFI
jgi:hypothetical protein